MARADTVTKLPLDRWFKIMGVNPLHGNGVYLADTFPIEGCRVPWLQYSWQDVDRIGRDDLALAIAEAEATIERYLGYRLLPAWEVDEWRPTPRPYRPEFVNYNAHDIRGYGQVVKADWGHFISGGIAAKSLVAAAAAIAWTDADADGYKETGTVVAATTVTDHCEIGIYYPGHSGADAWEIRPINVSIAAGTATITFRREQAVTEALLEAITAQGVDGTADANFLATVDIYRKYNDPSTQVTLQWEPLGECGCGDGSCLACQYSTQTGCLILRNDPRLSQVTYKPATWNTATAQFDAADLALTRAPDTVKLYYRAGLRNKALSCPYSQMDPQWERAVAYMASALLERPLCECSAVHQRVEMWRTDLAFSTGITELASYNLSPADLDNPFGTRRGEIFAWKRVLREALGEVVGA